MLANQNTICISRSETPHLIEILHQHGIVGPSRGSRARLVLIPSEQLQPALDALRAVVQPEHEDTNA
jgi:hypothetical protein